MKRKKKEQEWTKVVGHCPGCGIAVSCNEINHHCSKCNHILRLEAVKLAQKATAVDVQSMIQATNANTNYSIRY